MGSMHTFCLSVAGINLICVDAHRCRIEDTENSLTNNNNNNINNKMNNIINPIDELQEKLADMMAFFYIYALIAFYFVSIFIFFF